MTFDVCLIFLSDHEHYWNRSLFRLLQHSDGQRQWRSPLTRPHHRHCNLQCWAEVFLLLCLSFGVLCQQYPDWCVRCFFHYCFIIKDCSVSHRYITCPILIFENKRDPIHIFSLFTFQNILHSSLLLSQFLAKDFWISYLIFERKRPPRAYLYTSLLYSIFLWWRIALPHVWYAICMPCYPPISGHHPPLLWRITMVASSALWTWSYSV